MIRYYLVPLVAGTRNSGPKYFNFFGAPAPILFPNQLWDAEHYGQEPSMLLCADMSNPDDALLVAQSGVTKFADNLDSQLGGNLVAMQNALEALKIPGNLLSASTTHRQVVRGIIGIFSLAQCMASKGRNIFAAGITLATTMSQIPVAARNDLDACLRGVDGGAYVGIANAATGATTVRQLLGQIANTALASSLLDQPV